MEAPAQAAAHHHLTRTDAEERNGSVCDDRNVYDGL